jgi:GNAT superfamily N-acetyltransferase
MRIVDLSEKNLDDLFVICSGNRAFAPRDDPILTKGTQIKKQLLLDLQEKYGAMVKIAYLDGKPVAQVSFCPEEVMPYLSNARKDVIFLQCIFSPFPDFQRKGAGAALMETLIEECRNGLSCLNGRPCSFLVTRPFAHEGDLSLSDFYIKYGFSQGSQEMFLELKGDYMPSEVSGYHSLPEDIGKTIILYNPLCEWGFFAAYKIKELIHEMDTEILVEVFNIWEQPKEYFKRPFRRITSAKVIADAKVISRDFWKDRENFLQDIKDLLRK